MQLNVRDVDSGASSVIDVSQEVFGRPYNEALLHQVVVSYQSNIRQGTRAQKSRADVRHSTKKPWKQKGVGRARSGMVSSPIWRGGGRAFPSSMCENFQKKINKKMYKAAISVVLSRLLEEERLIVLSGFSVQTHKTKDMLGALERVGLVKALIVVENLTENLILSSRNLPTVHVLSTEEVDILSLLYYENVVLTVDAVRKIQEEWLA